MLFFSSILLLWYFFWFSDSYIEIDPSDFVVKPFYSSAIFCGVPFVAFKIYLSFCGILLLDVCILIIALYNSDNP